MCGGCKGRGCDEGVTPGTAMDVEDEDACGRAGEVQRGDVEIEGLKGVGMWEVRDGVGVIG